MKRWSIKIKVTLWYTGLVLILLMIMLGYLIYLSDQMSVKSARSMLEQIISEETAEISIKKGKLDLEEVDFYYNGVSILIYDTDGRLLAPKPNKHSHVNALLEADKVKIVDENEERWLVKDIYLDFGEMQIWVRGIVLMSTATSTMIIIGLIAIPFFLILTIFGGYYIIKRAFLPIERMVNTVETISNGNDLSKRIGVDSFHNEITKLGATFDQMFDRLQKSFEHQKQFTADASHELRTPIAINISQCEYALANKKTQEELKESLNIILKQSQKMSVLVSQLLLLSRADQGSIKLELETIHLSELCEIILEEMEIEATQNHITLECSIQPDIILRLDQTLIMRLITNLINNGIHYNKPQGKVMFALYTQDNKCYIKVEDTGIGISEEHMEKIWNRFYQVEQSRSRKQGGAGLGLAMAKWIVQKHNGKITVQSKENVGSIFLVEFLM